MNRYRMTLSYDGSAFSGWQIQGVQKPSIQGHVQEALRTVTGEGTIVHSSGRTDAGVHARGQVAHFELSGWHDPARLLRALNAVLPPDIRVMALRRARADFHARKSATRKQYRYFIWNEPYVPPFVRLYRAHVRDRLDAAAMQAAARRLVGRHDFAAFTANPNREIESTTRHLMRLDVRRRGAEIVIIAESEGFLYKMVRSLAGFLIRVGEGALAPEVADEILASRLRTARVPTAPPQGLFLWWVRY